MDPSDPSGLEDAVMQLQDAGEAADQEWMDEEKDLKIDKMDLVLKMRERQRLLQVCLPSSLAPSFAPSVPWPPSFALTSNT